MSSTSRSKKYTVIQDLVNNPEKYSFLQTVRLLERAQQYEPIVNKPKYPVAGYERPDNEVIRFSTNQRLEFYPSEINSINYEANIKNSKQWNVLVNIMGLTGAMGVLPYHYTELILQRLRLKDKTLLYFLDLFNHRTISLFYQASIKYRLPIEYERKKISTNKKIENDVHTKSLLSIIGLGTTHLKNRLHIRDESLLFYSGFFSQQIKTSSGLKKILQHYFNVPIKINEFVGQWQTLIDDVRTRLTSNSLIKGQNACLGNSALIGQKAWFAQDKIKIVIGPLNKNQLQRFSPGSNTTLIALNEIVQFYAGLELNYDFIIQIRQADIPTRVVLDKNNPPILNWNAWLSQSGKSDKIKEEIVNIVVSPTRLFFKNRRNTNDYNRLKISHC